MFSINSYKDNRGLFEEIFNKNILKKKLNFNFENMQTSVSISKKNVFRGFHFQRKKPIGQIVYVLKGKVLDIIVDIRKNSKTFGSYEAITLSDKNKKVIYMPEGFAHGFFTLDQESILIYHQSQKYIHKFDTGFNYKYNNIHKKFRFKKLILSEKDKNLQRYEDAKF